MTPRWFAPLALCLSAALLTGCSSPRLVEGQVQSFSTLAAVPAPASFRIERLPSQQTPAFDAIAALVTQSLARVGLRPDDAAPAMLVQIGTQAEQVPRHDPYDIAGFRPWGLNGWYGTGGWGVGGVWRMGPPTALHRRAVSLVLRDARTQAVVYETSAVHEDVWVRDPAVYGVLFDAALHGFPQPPAGPRQVRLPLPAPTP